MELLFQTILLLVILNIIFSSLDKKIDRLGDKVNFFSLLVSAVISIIAYEKIQSRDIRIIYSLGLIIASAVGRYGTDLTKNKKTSDIGIKHSTLRQLIYKTLFIAGLIGLVLS